MDITQFSPQNFGGTFIFFGGVFGPDALGPNNEPVGGIVSLPSIERFRRTEVLLDQGFTGAQIRALGGGATQFRLSSGNPETKVSQWDFGGYMQDDWKVRPNFTLSLGLRYENQKNIDSNFNFAPRAWFCLVSGRPTIEDRSAWRLWSLLRTRQREPDDDRACV